MAAAAVMLGCPKVPELRPADRAAESGRRLTAVGSRRQDIGRQEEVVGEERPERHPGVDLDAGVHVMGGPGPVADGEATDGCRLMS